MRVSLHRYYRDKRYVIGNGYRTQRLNYRDIIKNFCACETLVKFSQNVFTTLLLSYTRVNRKLIVAHEARFFMHKVNYERVQRHREKKLR